MNKQEQLALANEISDIVYHLLDRKGDDYADEDRLSNFKRVASILSKEPFDICLTLIGIKIARITNLINKDARNESMEDSIQDLITYSYLLKMIHAEQRADNN
jgi:hypothetical protein